MLRSHGLSEQFLNRTRRMGYLPGDPLPSLRWFAKQRTKYYYRLLLLINFTSPVPANHWAQVLSLPYFVLPPKYDKNFIPRVLYSSFCLSNTFFLVFYLPHLKVLRSVNLFWNKTNISSFEAHGFCMGFWLDSMHAHKYRAYIQECFYICITA